ncbi:MAG TPA: glycosyltransferase family 2 protein [Candidatus Tumulicola sp.]
MKIARALTIAAAALAVAGLAVQCVNLRRFSKLRPARGRPRSIVACLAVRDEAPTVVRCIEALLAQPEVEAVAVCDDRSIDGTLQILERLQSENPRVWIATLPAGSGGSKRAALSAAAARAGDCDIPYLLFTDADVVFEDGAAGALQQCARTFHANAVSAWPRVRVRGLSDVLFAPLVPELLLQVLPMWRPDDPRCTAGNGQAFLVERRAYFDCGGHDGAAVVEDVELARRLRSAGFRVALASAADVAVVDGYGSARGALDGLGRSLYGAGGAIACVAYALWQCAPACAIFGLRKSPMPAAVALSAVVAARALQARHMREPLACVVLAFVSHAVAALGAIRAAFLGASGRLTWRGRTLVV